jgi:hypothetical protein
MRQAIRLAGIFSIMFSVPVCAQLLDVQGDVGLSQTNAQAHAFTFSGGKMVIGLAVDSHPGTVTFEVQAPDGASLAKQTGGVLSMDGWTVSGAQSGKYTFVVTPHQTAGHWKVRVYPLPSSELLHLQILSGVLMMLVALGSAIWWLRRSRVQLRWFWAGAAIWTVGVALKFAVASVLNPIFIGTGGPPRAGFVAGIVYCGLMTGIFEIGVTLGAALIWRRWRQSPSAPWRLDWVRAHLRLCFLA